MPGAGATTGSTTTPRNGAVAQQDRMRNCNAQAKSQSLAGDKRKTFMSACLSGKTPDADKTTTASAPKTPQERMKACNADATSQKLTGDARRSFVSTCLKG